MKILLAADHAGYELKNKILDFLKEENFEVEDMGAFVYDADDDYPKIIIPLAMRIISDPDKTKGIIIGKSGNGEAMIANRFTGIRASVYYGKNPEIIRLSREHNNSNILALAGGFLEDAEAKQAVRLWLATPFTNEARHIRRNEMLDNIG